MRTRMIFEVSKEVQMAIKLQAIKTGRTTGQVVSEAIAVVFPGELKEAREVIKEQRGQDAVPAKP